MPRDTKQLSFLPQLISRVVKGSQWSSVSPWLVSHQLRLFKIIFLLASSSASGPTANPGWYVILKWTFHHLPTALPRGRERRYRGVGWNELGSSISQSELEFTVVKGRLLGHLQTQERAMAVAYWFTVSWPVAICSTKEMSTLHIHCIIMFICTSHNVRNSTMHTTISAVGKTNVQYLLLLCQTKWLLH